MLSYAEERATNIARNKHLLASLSIESLQSTTEPRDQDQEKDELFSPSIVGNKRKKRADSDSDCVILSSSSDSDSGSDYEEPDAKARSDRLTKGPRRSSRISNKPSDAMTAAAEWYGATPQPLFAKTPVRKAKPVKRQNTTQTYPRTPLSAAKTMGFEPSFTGERYSTSIERDRQLSAPFAAQSRSPTQPAVHGTPVDGDANIVLRRADQRDANIMRDGQPLATQSRPQTPLAVRESLISEDSIPMHRYADERDVNTLQDRRLLAQLATRSGPQTPPAVRDTLVGENANTMHRYADERDVNIVCERRLLAPFTKDSRLQKARTMNHERDNEDHDVKPLFPQWLFE